MFDKDKIAYIKQMQDRTKRFAKDIIFFCNTLEKGAASNVIIYQLVKSATSTGANYRAASVSRSKKEFYSKMCIVVEESDETEYWLELIKDVKLSDNINELDRLLIEANEIKRIMMKAKSSVYKNKNSNYGNKDSRK